jgi:hypothetical protein
VDTDGVAPASSGGDPKALRRWSLVAKGATAAGVALFLLADAASDVLWLCGLLLLGGCGAAALCLWARNRKRHLIETPQVMAAKVAEIAARREAFLKEREDEAARREASGGQAPVDGHLCPKSDDGIA